VASEPMHFYLGMLAITFGEIVVFANGYQMIESLAPPRMKGAYMGTTNLGHSGVVVGPVIGGMLLELGGGKLLFTVMGLVTVVVSFLYLQAKKARVKYPRA
jgi:MFS family permease